MATARFEYNQRRLQEMKMRPAADCLYQSVFGPDIDIKRFDNADESVLDINFAIDVQISFPNGQLLTGQEKFLSPEFAGFQSITVEYYQNAAEEGDWFKLASQFYMTGYATDDWLSFDPWIIVYWPVVVQKTQQGSIKWLDNKNLNGRARASFRYTYMVDLVSNNPDCVIASSFD